MRYSCIVIKEFWEKIPKKSKRKVRKLHKVSLCSKLQQNTEGNLLNRYKVGKKLQTKRTQA